MEQPGMPSKPATPNIEPPFDDGKPASGLLSVQQAAAFLNMSEGWLYQSGIPFVRLGRCRRYRLSDLQGFVEQKLSHGRQKGEA